MKKILANRASAAKKQGNKLKFLEALATNSKNFLFPCFFAALAFGTLGGFSFSCAFSAPPFSPVGRLGVVFGRRGRCSEFGSRAKYSNNFVFLLLLRILVFSA